MSLQSPPAIFRTLLVIALCFCFDAKANLDADHAQIHAYNANGHYEKEVLEVIEAIRAARLGAALELANKHVERFPKSQIGHLLRADILQAMSGQLRTVGDSPELPESNLSGFKHQMKLRWSHANDHQKVGHDRVPASLLDLGDHKYVLVADMPMGRLYVYENRKDGPWLVRDYYLTLGSEGYGKQVEGDNKTPVGVYEVNSYIEGARLPDLYGKGAFPVDYPNRYDRYKKRTGYGIWLHGTPSDTYARSPWASEGCFVLSNDDLLDIGQFVDAETRTPVVLSDGIEWVDRASLAKKQHELLTVIDSWRQAWESLDTEAYTRFYRQHDFNFGEGDFSQWAQRKATVNQAKSFVQVDLKIDSIFAYPGDKDMFVVKFRQNYLSNNYSGTTSKKQFWQKSSNGDWQIIYEG